MAAVSRENWVERIRDPKIECMSRDEMAALQSRRLVEVVNRVYNNVEFYRKKMQEIGITPNDINSVYNKRRFKGKLSFWTFGNTEKGCCPCAGNIRYNRKTDDCSLFAERCRSMGGMCGKRTDDGRTYRGRYYTRLL